MYKVTKIIPVRGLPVKARLIKPTGVVLINADIWHDLELPARKFILLHEEGHYVLETSNEIEADTYAFENYVFSEPYSLKKVLKTISETLDIQNNPLHRERFNNIVEKVLQYDYKITRNNKILEFMKISNIKTKAEQNLDKILLNLNADFLRKQGFKAGDLAKLSEKQRLTKLVQFMQTPKVKFIVKKLYDTENFDGDIQDYYEFENYDNIADFNSDYEDFGGRSKERKENRQDKREAKKEAKKEEKQEKKEVREEKREERKENRQEFVSKVTQVLDPIVTKAANAFGVPIPAGLIAGLGKKVTPEIVPDKKEEQKNEPQKDSTKPSETETEEEKKKRLAEEQKKAKMKKIYTGAGIAGGSILLFLILFMLFKPKKNDII